MSIYKRVHKMNSYNTLSCHFNFLVFTKICSVLIIPLCNVLWKICGDVNILIMDEHFNTFQGGHVYYMGHSVNGIILYATFRSKCNIF